MILTLPSNRIIRVERLIIAQSVHSGYLAGHPARITNRIRETLKTDIIDACPCFEELANNILILDNNEQILPKYRIIADLISTPVMPNNDDHFSELIICWFTDNIDTIPTNLIMPILSDELWQEYAVNLSF